MYLGVYTYNESGELGLRYSRKLSSGHPLKRELTVDEIIAKKDLELKDIIIKAFNHRGYKKGSRSIKMVLENEFNLIINRKCIQPIMRKIYKCN